MVVEPFEYPDVSVVTYTGTVLAKSKVLHFGTFLLLRI
jgi:hypothetical protein